MNYPDWPSQLIIRKRVIQNEIILEEARNTIFMNFPHFEMISHGKEHRTPHDISTTHKIMNYPDWPSQLVIRKRVIQNDLILDQIPFLVFKTFTNFKPAPHKNSLENCS